MQLLWVNLIMDTLAALALATDPPQRSILDRLPERRSASIITPTMWKMILGQAAYQLAITLTLYFVRPVKESLIPGLEDGERKAHLRTVIFNTFVWMQIFNQWNNRRLDNKFNILEGITKNYFFLGISFSLMAVQVLIIFVGGQPFSISKNKQTLIQWAVAIFFGLLSIPVGMILRLIPDSFLAHLIPSFIRHRAWIRGKSRRMARDEEFGRYPDSLSDVRDELVFIKRVRGGRLNTMRFAVRHPRETVARYARSPMRPRPVSLSVSETPSRASSIRSTSTLQSESNAGAPEMHRRPKSNRRRSSSSLAAPAVMSGIVAAGVAANWSPRQSLAGDEEGSEGHAQRQGSMDEASMKQSSTGLPEVLPEVLSE